MKTCTRCAVCKPLDEFYANKSRCSGCAAEYRRAYYQANKEKKQTQAKERYAKKRDLIIAQVKARVANDREAYRAYRRDLWRRKVENDPLYALRKRVRCLTTNMFSKKGWPKKSKTQQILGCDFPQLEAHLISTALKNYGYFTYCTAYEIDHVTPLATASNAEELAELCHYGNLQYLTPSDNRSKGGRLNWNLNNWTDGEDE